MASSSSSSPSAAGSPAPVGPTLLRDNSNNNNNNNGNDGSLDTEQQQRQERERVMRLKELGRESRLSFRNYAEAQLRRRLKDEALDVCNPQIKEFAACAQEKGLLVVVSCHSLFRQVNACLHEHNGEAAWLRYKDEHKEELEQMTLMSKKK